MQGDLHVLFVKLVDDLLRIGKNFGVEGPLAVVGAVLASSRFPIGVARRADPDIGIHADWMVLTIGVAAIAGLLAVITFIAARRATRSPVVEQTSRRRRGSKIVELTGTGLSPVATTGLRMAVEPGRGESAVPLRSAFLGTVIGVLGVTAALMFGSSLGHLATTPRLYGWTWDFQTSDNGNTRCDADGETLQHADIGADAPILLGAVSAMVSIIAAIFGQCGSHGWPGFADA